MPPDPWKDLLERADAAGGKSPTRPPSKLPTDLGAAVRCRGRRQYARRRRMMAGALVLALVCAAAWVGHAMTTPRTGAAQIARVQSELATMRTRRRQRQARLEELMALQRQDEHLQSARAALALAQASRHLNDPRDRAAMIIVREADRRDREYGQTAQATADYQRVVQLFGASEWAGVARQRLASLNAPK